MNRFLKLHFSFNVEALLRDLAVCEKDFWANHYNTNDYSGSWSGISLRSANGNSSNILATESGEYLDTPLLNECNYFKRILSAFHCELETVRLLSLAPGSLIKTHRDRGLSYSKGCFRLHIPIITDAGVNFVVDGERLEMQAGECWYANFDLPHSVEHFGTVNRVHLIIDGRRNSWTDELFLNAGYDIEAEKQPVKYDENTTREMIAHLEAMGTETALKMVASLKAQINSE